VRNGPDLKRVRPAPEDARLRARASTIVGYVGTLGYQDGVDYLIRAIHRMVHDLGRKDVLCVIIGRGDAAEELAELTRSLDLENHVWLTGYVTDQEMLSYLSTADICADPAPSNPFNDRSTMIKMMEYMALGKPIVAFDLLEHRNTASDAALYARPNDELDFARQISSLMDDSIKRHSMGRIGRKRIEKELAWHHQAKYLLRAYESLSADSRKQH
jgi:glycosyltransferase involved in cell wall biosynthesis